MTVKLRACLKTTWGPAARGLGRRQGGAVMGDIEGLTTGVGPVLNWLDAAKGSPTLLEEVSRLPELDVSKRLKGDCLWCKLPLFCESNMSAPPYESDL